MKFSIVTPSRDYGRYLAAAASSVLSQNGVELEYFVHDACSTDTTPEVLASLRGDPRAHVTVERDGGQTNAINKGFARATGDWLGWLNADEAYLPGALEQVHAFVAEHPDVDVVYGDTLFVDERTGRAFVKREHAFDERILTYYGCYLSSVSTFFRRECALRAGPLDESLRCVMDFEYWLRLARGGAKFAYIPRPLGLFRVHGANVSDVFAARRRRERHDVQLRYGGLDRWPERLRIRSFEVLRHVFTARRCLAKAMRAA